MEVGKLFCGLFPDTAVETGRMKKNDCFLLVWPMSGGSEAFNLPWMY